MTKQKTSKTTDTITTEILATGELLVWCDACNNTFQAVSLTSEDAVQEHIKQYHPNMVLVPEPEVEVTPTSEAPVPEKPKKERKAKAKAAAPVEKSTEQTLRDLLAALAEDAKRTKKLVCDAMTEAKRDVDKWHLYQEVVAVRDLDIQTIEEMKALPEGYVDQKAIERLQARVRKANTLLSDLMEKDPGIARGRVASVKVDLKVKLENAMKEANKVNSEPVHCPEAEKWIAEETQRFNGLMSGSIWVPCSKREEGIPFLHDCWWRLMYKASKAGIPMPQRTIENLEPLFEETFEDRLYKYGFHTGLKSYKVRVERLITNELTGVNSAITETVNLEVGLPVQSWYEEMGKAMIAIHRRIFGFRPKSTDKAAAEKEREVEFDNQLGKLGFRGTRDEVLSASYIVSDRIERRKDNPNRTATEDAYNRALEAQRNKASKEDSRRNQPTSGKSK